MAIFRRRRRGAHASGAAPTVESDAGASDLSVLEPEQAGADPAEPPQTQQQPVSSSHRDDGPFDVDEEPPRGDRLDLGSLQVPPVDGLTLQLELDEATGSVTAVRLLLGGSQAQLQAFAAPRSAALWPQIRGEIADTVHQQGGETEVVDGPVGTELLAHVPAGGPPLRFLGVDGPRWFLRAVLSGPAATDAAAAAPLVELVKGTVVVRGAEAMAPRELLPLRLPDVEGLPPEPSDDADGPGSLDPFERGPEITEVR